MKSKGAMLFWVDVLILTLFSALIATGGILRWVLPPGSGGGQHGAGVGRRGGSGPAMQFWNLGRHDWGDIHFWIAVAMIGGILIHLLLHFGWIRAATPRYLLGRQRRSGPSNRS